LFFFISAPASAGKGTLYWVRKLGGGLAEYLKEEYKSALEQYEAALQEYELNEADTPKPSKPNKPKLFIPGNSSSSSIIATVHNNKDFGLIFETEADTLTNMLKLEWGNFSDIIRKAFHHEPITLLRKTNEEDLEIEKPHLSIVLSGTPKQVASLLSSIENGFFSRFLFYDFPQNITWKNVFEVQDTALETFFQLKANTLVSYCLPFFSGSGETPINAYFRLTTDQQKGFNAWFEEKLEQLCNIYGADIVASVKRLGVSYFRIAMLLSAVRHIEKQMDEPHAQPTDIICNDADFKASQEIISVLLAHTVKVYRQLQKKHRNKFASANKQVFYDILPDTFERAVAMDVASCLGINLKTAEKYLGEFIGKEMLTRVKHNNYSKYPE
jgi:hypothetical protein